MMERPPGEPLVEGGGLFANAHNVVIYGGQFTATVQNGPGMVHNAKDPFQKLQENVAPSAFHNSAQRVDPPRCHENTRLAVLDEIFAWISCELADRVAWILWMNGAAGAGKTAIGQSVAELCVARGILVASFFFFRTDPTRNTIMPVVATLVYQIIQILPSVKDHILSIVERNPLIFQQSFETQLEELLIRPLRGLRTSGLAWRLLLIIDGIDECNGLNHQIDLVSTTAKVLAAKDVPVIVMFGSRAENHLKMAFNSPKVGINLLRMPLDDHYLPDNDIHLFLDDGFINVKQTHPFGHLIERAWPAEIIVREIVNKSSGQFIYAAVVMKFVSLPTAHPAQQLEIVRGLRPTGAATPFAQLDALYRHIFSCVQNIQQATSFLAFIILGQSTDIAWIALFFGLTPTDVHVALADLASVITCEEHTPRILHASLPDFLLDRTRSGEFHISASAWGTQLAIQWYTNTTSGRSQGVNYSSTIINLLKHAVCGPDLREGMYAFMPDPILHTDFFCDYLPLVKQLDFGDGGQTYRHQLNMIVRFIKKERPDDKDINYLEKGDAVTRILDEIAREGEEKTRHPTKVQAEEETFDIEPENAPHNIQSSAKLMPESVDAEQRERVDPAKSSLRSRLKARLKR